jgi:hypothetical protein
MEVTIKNPKGGDSSCFTRYSIVLFENCSMVRCIFSFHVNVPDFTLVSDNTPELTVTFTLSLY